MYWNVQVSIWNMMGDDESNQEKLEQNVSKHENIPWNMTGGNVSD